MKRNMHFNVNEIGVQLVVPCVFVSNTSDNRSETVKA